MRIMRPPLHPGAGTHHMSHFATLISNTWFRALQLLVEGQNTSHKMFTFFSEYYHLYHLFKNKSGLHKSRALPISPPHDPIQPTRGKQRQEFNPMVTNARINIISCAREQLTKFYNQMHQCNHIHKHLKISKFHEKVNPTNKGQTETRV